MWVARENSERKDIKNQLIAIGIDKDKGSQNALKWAIDNIIQRSQTVILIHVKLKTHSYISSPGFPLQVKQWDQSIKDLFLRFRCFCTRKDIQCHDVMLEDTDVARALLDFVAHAAIEVLVMGAASKGSLFSRFSKVDTPAIVTKAIPDFCTVYVISKGGKISSMRSASQSAPTMSTFRNQILSQTTSTPSSPNKNKKGAEKTTLAGSPLGGVEEDFRSPFTRLGRQPHIKSYGELMASDIDISYVSSGRPSIERTVPSYYDCSEAGRSTTRLSTSSDNTDYFYESARRKSSVDVSPISASPPPEYSFDSFEDSSIHWSAMQPQAMVRPIPAHS